MVSLVPFFIINRVVDINYFPALFRQGLYFILHSAVRRRGAQQDGQIRPRGSGLPSPSQGGIPSMFVLVLLCKSNLIISSHPFIPLCSLFLFSVPYFKWLQRDPNEKYKRSISLLRRRLMETLFASLKYYEPC